MTSNQFQYIYVTWRLLHLKSPVTRPSVQQMNMASKRINIKNIVIKVLCEGGPAWPVYSLHTGQVRRTPFPRHAVLTLSARSNIYSERRRGAGFRSVNPAERWRENPARALARAGFSQHLECGIHRSESSPEGSFALIPRPVARWAKTTP